MKLTLFEHTPQNIRRARKILRRTTSLRLFVRGGKCFTVTYNPGRQPNSKAQLNNRSIFKQANDRVAADFANPAKRKYWLRKLKSQSRYKTARGLARAYYMALLKTSAEKHAIITPIRHSFGPFASSLHVEELLVSSSWIRHTIRHVRQNSYRQ